MKKNVIGFLVALAVMVILSSVNKLLFEIPPFMIGWVSCMGFYIGKEVSE